MTNRIEEILNQEINAIKTIPNNDYDGAVNLIHKQVHNFSGKLVISGMGKAGQIGHNMATTFSSTGTPSVFLHPSESQHGDLGIMQENDILFLISNSGKTREILELMVLAKRLQPNLKIVALTGNPDSELAQKSNITLLTGNPNEVGPLGLTPTTSTTCMTVIGDIMVVLLMEKINFTKEQYALRHHSGYLGEKAREQ